MLFKWRFSLPRINYLYRKKCDLKCKDLFDSTGNSTQYSIMAYMGKELQYCKVTSLQLIKINEKQNKQKKNLKKSGYMYVEGFPGAQMVKNPPAMQETRPGFDPWVRKIPWRREWKPTPFFLSGELHGQRILAGYSPWGHRDSDTTE